VKIRFENVTGIITFKAWELSRTGYVLHRFAVNKLRFSKPMETEATVPEQAPWVSEYAAGTEPFKIMMLRLS
jgi:hypothetical protein